MPLSISGTALTNIFVDVGKRERAAADVCSPLDAFRFVSSKHSRFKAPPPCKEAQKRQVAEQKQSTANRVLMQNAQPEPTCLPPLVPEQLGIEPCALILGSAPSVESLSKQQYYAHKQNHFWPVVADIFQLNGRVPADSAFTGMDYAGRVQLLLQAGVVVWDICQTFVRNGSSDSALTCTVVNPVEDLIARYPSIEVVGLNGQCAYKLFLKNIVKSGKLPRDVRYVCLPSTSPLNAMKNAVEEKARQWREALQVAGQLPSAPVPTVKHVV